MIGQSNGRGKYRIFRISANSINGLNSLGKGISTGLDRYNPISDSICLVEKLEDEKVVTTIASVDSRHRQGKLYQSLLV